MKESYRNMAYRLGRQPMMMDFVRFGDKDPALFVAKKESFFEFVQYMEPYNSTLNASHRAVLKMMSLELANGKRIEELLVLRHLLTEDSWSTAALAKEMNETYHSCRLRKRWKAWPACWICNFLLKRPEKNTADSRSFPLKIMLIQRLLIGTI